MTLHCSPARFLVLLLGLMISVTDSRADSPPLHQRINQLLAKSHSGKVAPPASDEAFLRRAFLDLNGTIPPVDTVRAFLKDSSPDKRQKLITQLINSPEYARHMAEVFDLMLLERRNGRNVPDAEWQTYLHKSFLDNKPWDQMVREILTADGADKKNRGPAKFYLVRNAEADLLTKDISRLFLGMNVECAQCHNHPVVEAYKQDFYYGIYAFLSRSYVVKDAKLKVSVLGEKAVGDVTFTSVFDPKKVTKKTGPRLPYRSEMKEPKVAKGKEYKVKPTKTQRGVPTYSRRAALGPELARADNLPFVKNIANRLWAIMMGRGLVDPVDFQHPENPPSNPAVLQAITEELIAKKFDMKHIIRELALTEIYRRSSKLPDGMESREDAGFAVAQVKPIPAEALGRALLEATGMTEVSRKSLGKKLNETNLHSRITKLRAPFVRAVSGSPGEVEEFVPTLEQALFIANNALIQSWITPRAGNLADRLMKMKDAQPMAEEMYLSILTRMPTKEEVQDVKDYVMSSVGAKRSAAIQEYIWALLASAEMRFNH